MAYVHVPPDTSPDSGGGPLRRSPLVTTRSGDGMPPYGWPQMVLRTPHQVVPDMEPGGAVFPGLDRMKFLPDGRLVAAEALGGYLDAVPATGQIDLATALARISTWYRDLQLAAGRIIDTFTKLDKHVPCSVRSEHNKAVKAYLTYARSVFASATAAKAGLAITQTILDRQGKVVKTITGVTPAIPTIFTIADCKGATAALGAVPLFVVATAGAVIKYAIKIGAVLLTLAGLKGIFVSEPEKPTPVDPKTYRSRVDDYLDCLQKLGTANITFEKAEPRCAPLLVGQVPKPEEKGLGLWGTIGIVGTLVAVGVVGGIILYRRTSPAERALRTRREEAEMEADELRREAARIAREGREPRFEPLRRRSSRPVVEYEPASAFEGSHEVPAGVPGRFRGCFCV